MDRLTANQWLGANGSIASPNGYTLIYQGDGNLVVYDGNQSPSWSSDTGSAPGQVIMQGDGNFVMYDASGAAVWRTETDGNPGALVIMQGDGNLVVYTADGHALWASQDQDSGGWFSAITGAIGDVVSAVVDGVETVVNAAVDTVESIISPVFNLAGALIGLIESIPIIGRAIAWVVNAVSDVIQRILSLPEYLLVWLGWMPEKRLRIMVLIPEVRGDDVADISRVRQYIQKMIDVYKDQCNVRVLPALPFQYSSPFQGTPTATDSYYGFLPGIPSQSTLVVSCGTQGAEDDLGITSGSGPEFQALMNLSKGFWGAGRRAITYGAPITTFAVKAFTDGHDGCSDSLATDWVLVHFKAVRQNLDDVNTASAQSATIAKVIASSSQNNVVIVLIAFAEQSARAAPVIQNVSGGSAVWQRRSQSNGSRHGNLEAWWSTSPKPLPKEEITVTYNGEFERVSLCTFGVAGVNLSTPWDGNPSLPKNSTIFSSDLAPSVANVSTDSPQSFLLYVVGTSSVWNPESPPLGYSLLAGVENSGGSKAAELGIANLVRLVPLSDESVSWGAPLPATDGGAEAIFDAISLVNVLDDESLLLTMAHENGHACGLSHTDGTIMSSGYPGRTPTLTKAQIAAIRVSRHVTYL